MVSKDDEIPEGQFPLIFTTGTLLSHEFSLSSDIISRSLILAPSLPGIPGLIGNAAREVLLQQMEIINGWDCAASSVLRIPSSISLEDLEDILPKFIDAGVHAASFLFNDELGDEDLNNIHLRSHLPRNWMTIALGRIRPSMIPILVYSGFDIIDTGYAEESAHRLVRIWPLVNEKIQLEQPSRFCNCTHCQNLAELESAILNHNLTIFRSQVSESTHAIRDRSLRWLVETSTHSSPGVSSFLRKMDSQNFSFLEEFTPTGGSGSLPLIGPESYNSPAVRRFREKVANRYTPPDYKKIVLLLPCSARKPYSDSKTHRRYSDTLERVLGSKRDSLSETIITSPLGAVPRELERIYPAANYDIPVTGDWDHEETAIAADALVTHLGKFNEDVVVVAHVSGGYLSVVRMAEERIKQSIIYTTHEGSPSSRVSLKALEETLSDLTSIKKIEGRRTLLEDTVRATADYQFGQGAGDVLVPRNAKVGGKVYGTIIVRDQGTQLCAYKGSNGTISLTLEGAERLKSLERYWVKFEGDVLDGSTLFAIGVNYADDRIRPGDEVIIRNSHDQVVGTGRSEMSGREMCDFQNGIAVKVRHKKR
jgi:archaeosine synthase